MIKNNKKSYSILIIFIAWVAYIVSYLGRSDYSACILEIVTHTGVTRATAGMVSSVFALCNAFGQAASGFILKKLPPLPLIGVELFTVAVINFLFPGSNSFVLMAILWGINGCMQSILLCGITQIFLETLQEPYLSRGVVLLNTVGAVGGALNYVLSWFMIRYINWQAVFITVATLLTIHALVWCLVMPKLTGNNRFLYCKKKMPGIIQPDAAIAGTTDISGNADAPEKQDSLQAFFSQLACFGTAFVILGAFFIGMLRESVSLWIPSYMNEIFGLSNSLSTIVTMFVPCLQICGALLGGKVGRQTRILHFPSAIAFLLSGTCLFLLPIAGSSSSVITLVLFVINAVCMTAALTFLLSLFPIRFFGKGQAPVLVGLINFSVHAGDFVASAGIGWLSQAGGWWLTFGSLGTLALLSAIICMIGGYICRKEVTAQNV